MLQAKQLPVDLPWLASPVARLPLAGQK
uniref:Uncharacterized protein n=1 Tax=mine drainage metagenome TaxID=410659 RepID=E6Q0F5_9ZZZZ